VEQDKAKKNFYKFSQEELFMAQEGKIRFKSEMLPTFTQRGFQPILERLCSVLEKQDLQPMDSLEGKSVKPISEWLETPLLRGFFKPYAMEKCEKLSLSNFLIMDKILVAAITAIPLDGYEFPMMALEWSETENTINVLVDFIPLIDLVMSEGYREIYLDPLEQYWSKYKDLPGMGPNPFAWCRQILSPYYLSGIIPKDSEQNIKGCLELFQNYLEVWIDLCQRAELIADDKARDYIKARKAKIRKIFVENDEGSKSMAQMIGKELQELTARCLF
jgi:hypothetical protein